MTWVMAVAILVGAVTLYTTILNGAFLRCPYCRKMGSWRFDPVEDAIEELDEDGNPVRSTQRQSCRSCGGTVDHIWSDFEGRELRSVDE